MREDTVIGPKENPPLSGTKSSDFLITIRLHASSLAVCDPSRSLFLTGDWSLPPNHYQKIENILPLTPTQPIRHYLRQRRDIDPGIPTFSHPNINRPASYKTFPFTISLSYPLLPTDPVETEVITKLCPYHPLTLPILDPHPWELHLRRVAAALSSSSSTPLCHDNRNRVRVHTTGTISSPS